MREGQRRKELIQLHSMQGESDHRAARDVSASPTRTQSSGEKSRRGELRGGEVGAAMSLGPEAGGETGPGDVAAAATVALVIRGLVCSSPAGHLPRGLSAANRTTLSRPGQDRQPARRERRPEGPRGRGGGAHAVRGREGRGGAGDGRLDTVRSFS